MPVNILVTRTVAGILGGPMPDDTTVRAQYPAKRFHPTLPPMRVLSAEEDQALPDGYRATVWSEADADAWTVQQASASAGGSSKGSRRS